MQRLNEVSFKRKLTVVSFVTSATALLLVGFAFTAYAVHDDRETLARQLSTQADILGFTVTPALLFEDERAAQDALAALRADQLVEAAAVYRPDGSLFARYLRRGAKLELATPPRAGDADKIDERGGSYRLTRPLSDRGRQIGTLLLQADLAALEARVLRYLVVSVPVLGVSLLLALGVATLLQREISEPVLELANTARKVTVEKDYGIRAAGSGRDELGVLVEAFNEMLGEIQGRDNQLQTVNLELWRRTEELGRKNEEVEAFVYIVSHDLRAPLVNLQGFARELRLNCDSLAKVLGEASLPAAQAAQVRELMEDEIPTSLRFISASTTKFERLINALLQLSRSGRRELAHEPLDMAGLVAMTLDSLRTTIAKGGAEVEVGELPPAYGDPTAVGQVWSNLITNAVRYLEPGRPGRIRIRGERDGRFSRYSIEDNGVGIAATAQKKLFQVFQRMRPDLAEGEGIGLATVKRIVERHGGQIQVDSVEGKGTTFLFSLPAEPRQEGVL